MSVCPRGWVYNSPNCYKFVQEEQLIFEEADAACWTFDAKLLSINSFTEHRFVSDWLKFHDILPPSTWLTSGYISNWRIFWEGDNFYQTDTAITWPWISVVNSNTEGRVAYRFGGSEFGNYGWINVSASIPYNYICEIPLSESQHIDVQQRGEDYGYEVIDMKHLPRGPKLTNEPDNIIVVKGELSFYLECTSNGNPYPFFTWWKNINDNQQVETDEEMTSFIDSRYTLSSGRFTIDDPQIKDTGYYRCRAINDYGVVLSRMAQIQFGYLGEFPAVQPTDYVAKAYRGLRVDCNAPPYYPEVRYQWSKYGTASWFFPGGSWIFISQAGHLYFSELQPSDDKEHFCFVTLAAPSNYRMNTKQPPMVVSQGIWLIIIDETDATPFGPDIITHTFPSPFLRGLKLRLECIAYGTLPISYEWRRKDGRPFISGTTIIDRARVLEIDVAPLSAEGDYVCTAIGANGIAEKTITVVMETAPYFPYDIGDMFVDPGQSIKWGCKSVARPRATYRWYKNGNLIQNVPGEIEASGTRLWIKSVDKDRDEGMYQCSATNIHGTTFSTGRLKVLSFKPNFVKNPLPLLTLAPAGGTITIPCHVEAAPVPTVTWLKNGGNLNLIPGVTSDRITMAFNFDLILTEVQYSDAGIYTCEAENTNGKAANSTVVQVVEGVLITTPPVPTNVQVNQTVSLECHAAYNYLYDVTYQWKFNAYPIDFNLNPEYILIENQGISSLYVTHAQYEHSGRYECTVTTALHSDSRSALVTVTGPPGPPAGVYIEAMSVTSFTVQLVWTVGRNIDHGDPIISYDIEAESEYHPDEWNPILSDIPEYTAANDAVNLGKRTDQRTCMVTGLIPDTGYRFRVRAMNNFGRGKLASNPSVRIKTPSDAPVTAPRHVSGGGGKVGTLTITWEPLDISEHSGPNLGYNVYWKLQEDQQHGWMKDKILDKDAKRFYGDNAETEERIMFTVTIGIDYYYLQYDVKVGCYNDKGEGPNSTESVIYSAEGMPVARPIMLPNPTLNSTAVVVRWIPVNDDRETMKGRVRGYTVQYFLREDKFMPFEGYDPDNILQKEVYGQTDHALIIGLEANREYFARVQVWNSAGRGPKGEWRRSETANAAPSEYPTFVKVYPHTEQSVFVKWRGISTMNFESMLLGYKVRVWKVQDDIRTAIDKVVDRTPEAIIQNLQKETVYVLRVFGISAGGNGQQSDAVYFTVLGGNIPLDPATTEVCNSIIENCSRARSLLQVSSLLMVLLLTFINLLLSQS